MMPTLDGENPLAFGHGVHIGGCTTNTGFTPSPPPVYIGWGEGG
jgi:hypothetical protein